MPGLVDKDPALGVGDDPGLGLGCLADAVYQPLAEAFCLESRPPSSECKSSPDEDCSRV